MSERKKPSTDQEPRDVSIDTVVFDIGGVLFKDSDAALIAKLAESFGCTEADILEIFKELNTASNSGEMPEDEYLSKFYSRFSKKRPQNLDEARKPFINPEIYQPVDGMQEVVEELASNPKIKIFTLSNSIAPVAEVVRDSLLRLYPEFPPENVLISSLIGGSKAGDGKAFKKLIEITNLDLRTTLFIDDVKEYSDRGKSFGLNTFQFTSDPEKGVSAVNRFKDELRKVRLLS